ncbi:MAG: DUF5777 family beta-barrel protein [Bacteroidota bacterium]
MKKYLSNLELKRIAISIMLAFFATSFIFAQQATKEPNKPVSDTYNSGTFLENQTVITNPAKCFEFVINHRFGKISDGSKEAWGVYSPSNIRLGVNYSINNRLQVGIGATKGDKQTDLNLKWSFLQQTTNGKIPVSMTYYGSVMFDGRDTKSFNYTNFKEAHRFSYFNEILISRRFCKFFNLQVAPTYVHYNVTESASDTSVVRLRRNDNFGMSVLGKLNINSTISLFFEYDHNFTLIYKKVNDVYKEAKPVISVGFEKATGTHSFQLFVTTGESINYQKNMVYNKNTFFDDGGVLSGLMIGFNITRVFY